MDLEVRSLYNNWEQQLPKLLDKYHGVMLACSGGLDSTVLFHLFYNFTKEKLFFPLSLCHVNFNLRGQESVRDETFVLELGKKHNCEVFLHRTALSPTVNGSKKNGIQDWARKIRYQHFNEHAKNGWLIAIAQHQDDLVENVLFRLIRGTTPFGLCGMSEYHPPFIRPLLSCNKAFLEAYGTRHKILHCHDSSNDKIVYSRNKIRQQIVPVLSEIFPQASDKIARFARETNEMQSFVAASMASFTASLQGSGLQIKTLLQLPQSIALFVLTQAVGYGKKGRKQVNHAFFLNLLLQLKTQPSTGKKRLVFEAPAGCGFFTSQNGILRYNKEQEKPQKYLKQLRKRQITTIVGSAASIIARPQKEMLLLRNNGSAALFINARKGVLGSREKDPAEKFCQKNGLLGRARQKIWSLESLHLGIEQVFFRGIYHDDNFLEIDQKGRILQVAPKDFAVKIWSYPNKKTR